MPTPSRLATFEAWLLLALCDALPFYRAEAKPPTFLYRVALKGALNWTRTRRSHVPLPGLPAPTRNTNQLYAAITQLPELDRSLVLLHLDGFPYAEIAQVLGLTETNIGARLTRLRQRLKLADALRLTLREVDQELASQKIARAVRRPRGPALCSAPLSALLRRQDERERRIQPRPHACRRLSRECCAHLARLRRFLHAAIPQLETVQHPSTTMTLVPASR